MTEQDPSEAKDVVQRAIAAAAGGLVGVSLGGPVGAVLGSAAGVALEPLVRRVFDELSADGRNRAAQVLQEASDALESSPEETVELIGKDEGTRLIGGWAISAATRTAYGPKVRALGRALASGLSDDQARIDEEQLIIAAIAEMEAPHVSLLELIVGFVPRGTKGNVEAAPYLPPSPTNPDNREWTEKSIRAVRPTFGPVLPALLGTLQRHGLVAAKDDFAKAFDEVARDSQSALRRRYGTATRDTTTGITADGLRKLAPATSWSPTPLGEYLLAYFQDAAQAT